MKNFPHQFNDLNKLFKALIIVFELIKNRIPLTDENFGEDLLIKNVYTYRDKSLSIDEYLSKEKKKPVSNRGYFTVARDIRRLFKLLRLIMVHSEKYCTLTNSALKLLRTSKEKRKKLWRIFFNQLELEGSDGEISHPYRILNKLVQDIPGIETSKLMLALEAENDSDEEYEKMLYLAKLSIDQIIMEVGTTESMAKNAVKILPGVAEQLGDIKREGNFSYPMQYVIITEDEIVTEELKDRTKAISTFRKTTAEDIAKKPNLNIISITNIDLTEAIRIRQKKLVDHQRIVSLIGNLHSELGFELYEGKFDCLAVKNDTVLLYEIKTLSNSLKDQEKQAIKGVGQLKYYKFSIVYNIMGYHSIRELIVFSEKPDLNIIEFCNSESINVVWNVGKVFMFYNLQTKKEEMFSPNKIID